MATARDAARMSDFDAHIRQLDQTVSRLADRVAMERTGVPVAAAPAQSMVTNADESGRPATNQASEIAEADALVDLGLQTGHWTRRQRDELEAAIADLDVREQGRIKARVAAAINAGEVQMDMRR